MLRSQQAVNLVVTAVFLFHELVIVEVVKFPVFETVFMLFHLRYTQDRRQRVAEVHCADFATLGSSYLGFVSCAVVSHTAAYREVLLVKTDVLPSQAADLANAKSRIVGDLYGR